MKVCTVCRESKDFPDFYRSKASKDGYGYRCKPCDLEVRRNSRSRSPATMLGYRRRFVASKYGLSLEDYEAMFVKQEHKCAICSTTNPYGQGQASKRNSMSFAVDHDHDTGKIRGLLCNLCNRALGFFQDSVDIVQRAADYLKHHKASCH